MIFEYNFVALLTIIIGVIALFFFVIDKYPMESVSIGLLSALAIIQVIFPNGENNNISNHNVNINNTNNTYGNRNRIFKRRI